MNFARGSASEQDEDVEERLVLGRDQHLARRHLAPHLDPEPADHPQAEEDRPAIGAADRIGAVDRPERQRRAEDAHDPHQQVEHRVEDQRADRARTLPQLQRRRPRRVAAQAARPGDRHRRRPAPASGASHCQPARPMPTRKNPGSLARGSSATRSHPRRRPGQRAQPGAQRQPPGEAPGDEAVLRADEAQRADRRPVRRHRPLRREHQAGAERQRAEPEARQREAAEPLGGGDQRQPPGGVVVIDRPRRRLGRGAPPAPRRRAPPRSVATSIRSGSGRLSMGISGPSQGSSSFSCSARSTIRHRAHPRRLAQHVERRPRLLLDRVLGGEDLQRRGVARLAAPGRGQPPRRQRQRQRQHREEGQHRGEEAERHRRPAGRRHHAAAPPGRRGARPIRPGHAAASSSAQTRPSSSRSTTAAPQPRRAQVRVVGGDQHGLAHAVELDEERHQPARRLPVDAAGGLVGQDHLRAQDHRPRQRRPPPLAAGELRPAAPAPGGRARPRRAAPRCPRRAPPAPIPLTLSGSATFSASGRWSMKVAVLLHHPHRPAQAWQSHCDHARAIARPKCRTFPDVGARSR